MREIWRTTSDLFWQHPVLWLPVLAADLVGFLLLTIRSRLLNWLAAQIMTHHSVLSDPGAGHGMSRSMAISAGGVLFVITYFGLTLAYVLALLLTAARTERLLRHDAKAHSPTAGPARWTMGGILRLSGLVFGSMLALEVLFLSPMSYALPLFHRSAWMHAKWLGWSTTLVAAALVAWMVAPAAIRFVARPSLSSPSDAGFAAGRALAVLAMAASLTVTGCWEVVGQSVFGGPILRWAFVFVGSEIGALPYVALFIAFGVIVHRGQSAPSTL